MALRRRRLGDDHLTPLRPATRLGGVLLAAGRTEEAAAVLGPTFEILKGTAPDKDWPTWLAGHDLAVALSMADRTEDAARVGREVLFGRREIAGADSVGALKTASNLGSTLRSLGRYDEAIDFLADTFARGVRSAPDEEWPTWRAGHELAVTLAEAGRPAEAVPIEEQVLRARRRLLGPDSLDTLGSGCYLGMFLQLSGRLDEAVECLAETFERAKRAAPDEDSPTWVTGHTLAFTLALHGRLEPAVTVGREVLEARRRLHGADEPATLTSASNLGVDLRLAGRVDESIVLLADTFERGRRTGAEIGWRAGAHLVDSYVAAGRLEAARSTARTVLEDGVDLDALGVERLAGLRQLTAKE